MCSLSPATVRAMADNFLLMVLSNAQYPCRKNLLLTVPRFGTTYLTRYFHLMQSRNSLLSALTMFEFEEAAPGRNARSPAQNTVPRARCGFWNVSEVKRSSTDYALHRLLYNDLSA